MTVSSFLEYQLIAFDQYSLTTADVLKVGFYIVIAKVLLVILHKILHRKREGKTVDVGKAEALYQIIKYFIWTITVAVCLDGIGLNLTVLLASSAALFIGLGLGIQQIFRDFISGIILLFEGSIEVEDVVEVDGIVGRVQRVGFRTTEILDRNEINIIVPNSKFVDNSVINWSHNYEKTRFVINVSVAYGSDMDIVENCLTQAALQHKKVGTSDKPFARFKDFGESSVNFELYFWTENIFKVEQTKSEIRRYIYDLFLENNVKIPFPQREIHMNQTRL